MSRHKTLKNGTKNFRFFQNILRSRRVMTFLTADLESTQNLASYRRFLASKTYFGGCKSRNLIFAKNRILLFTLNRSTFRPNRRYHQNRHIRKYLPWIGILFVFLIFEIHRMPHTLPSKSSMKQSMWDCTCIILAQRRVHPMRLQTREEERQALRHARQLLL